MKIQLIYQEGTSNKFWNIEIIDNTHTVTYGRVGTAGVSKAKEFENAATAMKDAEKLIKSKIKKGYHTVSEKAKIIRDSYTFVGKPIKEFGLSINVDTAVKVLSGYGEELKVVDKLDKLAKLPNVSEMDTLVIGAWQAAAEGNDLIATGILNKLIELKDTFSNVQHLFIGDIDQGECEMSWINQIDYTSFYQHYPQLETFGVRGSERLKLGKIDLPNLKNLIVETGGLDKSVISDIINSNLINLEHLEIWLGTDEYGCTIETDELMPILNGTYPILRYLGLKNYHEQNDLAKKLKGASILKTIDTLDISMGVLHDEGAEALFNNEDLLNLKHINCRSHFFSAAWQEKLKVKFSGQNINLEDGRDAYDYDDEAYYYVEIGE